MLASYGMELLSTHNSMKGRDCARSWDGNIWKSHPCSFRILDECFITHLLLIRYVAIDIVSGKPVMVTFLSEVPSSQLEILICAPESCLQHDSRQWDKYNHLFLSLRQWVVFVVFIRSDPNPTRVKMTKWSNDPELNQESPIQSPMFYQLVRMVRQSVWPYGQSHWDICVITSLTGSH